MSTDELSDRHLLAEDDRDADHDVDVDRLFDVLSNSRRRFVLERLLERSKPMPLADLADEIAARELDVPIDDVPHDELMSVYTSLYHVHVPKMVDAGLFEYDQGRETVATTTLGDELAAVGHLLVAE